MNLVLVKNYIRAFMPGALMFTHGWPHRIKRINYTFLAHGYHINIDMICVFDRKVSNIIDVLNESLVTKGDQWQLKAYLGVIASCRDNGDTNGYKIIQDFIEYVIMTSDTVRVYINKLDIKSAMDIRDDKLNKLLEIGN